MKRKIHALIGIITCGVLITNSVAAAPNPTKKEEPTIEILDIISQPANLDELKSIESDGNNKLLTDSDFVDKQFTLKYNMNINDKANTIEFNGKYMKFSTENAYNGIIIAERIENSASDVRVTNCIFLTPEFAEKSFCDVTAENDEVVNVLTIDVNEKSQTVFKTIPVADISNLNDDIQIITEEHPDYVNNISRVRNIPEPDRIQEKRDGPSLSEKSRLDEQLFAMANGSNAQVRALSSVGNEVMNIVNTAGLRDWWTYPGFGKYHILGSQRVVTMNTNLIGNTYYSDCLIWQYSLGPTSGATSNSAYLQLKILYNVTIMYNNGNWSDYGANSGATAMRNSSVGIKTTGCGNNDFINEIEQKGQYNTGGGASPVESVLKKAFFKVVPYGSYISDTLDVLSSFVKTKVDSYSDGTGHIYYDSKPSVHVNQEGGYVRNAILKSGNYSMYFANKNYQQQKISIVKQGISGGYCDTKKFYYQSHYEIIGAYSSGFVSLFSGWTTYTRPYK